MGLAIDKLSGMTSIDNKFDLVILGLGKTGISCVRFFSNKTKTIAIVDSRFEPPGLEIIANDFPDIPLYLGSFNEEILCSANELIVSPGIAINEQSIKQAIKAGVRVIGDIELFCQHVSKPIIAITGSNGKSTVAILFSKMIEASGKSVELGGNIGTPALDLFLKQEPDYYVLELSSFQLETTKSLNAIAAVVLNITEDHMDRYSNFKEYAFAKQRIYAGTGTMVINLDDDIVAAFTRNNRKTICYTTKGPGKNAFGIRVKNGNSYIVYGESDLIAITDLGIRGKQNISNAMAALALGTTINLPIESMLSVLQDFQGLPHRCQWISNINGVDWYNDSKATNVGATCAAIESLAGNNNMVLIAGGEGKGADFSKLAEVAAGRVKATILMGSDANRLANVLKGIVDIYFALDMNAAVKLAYGISAAGGIVLLSPACASFDMFEDYQQRGVEFIEAISRCSHE